jgi:hypothetical protein
MPNQIIFAYFILCCLLISGGVYLIRGGSQWIFSFYFKRTPTPDKIPAAHIVAAGLTILYLAPYLNLVIGLTGYKLVELLLIHAALWFVTIMNAWEGYYSIGSSKSNRRASVGWIDWVLDKTFGSIIYDVPAATAAPGKSTAWWIMRDGTGMFLRMCHAFPLFLALGLFFDLHWYIGLLALQYTLLFAFITTLIYAAYNWIPIFPHTNAQFNWSEFGTGICFAGTVFYYLFTLVVR